MVPVHHKETMFRRSSVNFALFLFVSDIVLTLIALTVALYLRPDLPPLPFLVPMPEARMPIVLYFVVPFLWTAIFLLTSVYDPKRSNRLLDEIQGISFATGIAALVFAGLLYVAHREFSRYLFVLFLILDLAFIVGWRVLLRAVLHLVRLPAADRRVLIVGAGSVGRRVGQMIEDYNWTGLNFVGYIDDNPAMPNGDLRLLGKVQDAGRVVEKLRIDDVVVALPQKAYGQINELVLALHRLPVQVRVVPDYYSLAIYRATVDDFGGLPLINLRDPALNDYQRLMKRLFDLVIGLLALVVLSPFFLLIALLIWLDSPGPIFFLQKRVGENGRLFDMVKFRSMVVGAEELQAKVNEVNGNGDILHKHPDDPRVTRIGRLLRRTSIDELPQLFNVLKGEMSLVGPRPELPWLVVNYEPWQHKRLAVPQGMTGWWQVNGRSSKPMHLHTEDDLYYIQNYSLWMDIYIMLKTPLVILRGIGAY